MDAKCNDDNRLLRSNRKLSWLLLTDEMYCMVLQQIYCAGQHWEFVSFQAKYCLRIRNNDHTKKITQKL